MDTLLSVWEILVLLRFTFILECSEFHRSMAQLTSDGQLTGDVIDRRDVELFYVIVAAGAFRRQSDGDLVLEDQTAKVVQVRGIVKSENTVAAFAAESCATPVIHWLAIVVQALRTPDVSQKFLYFIRTQIVRENPDQERRICSDGGVVQIRIFQHDIPVL